MQQDKSDLEEHSRKEAGEALPRDKHFKNTCLQLKMYNFKKSLEIRCGEKSQETLDLDKNYSEMYI